eukprot:346173_1
MANQNVEMSDSERIPLVRTDPQAIFPTQPDLHTYRNTDRINMTAKCEFCCWIFLGLLAAIFFVVFCEIYANEDENANEFNAGVCLCCIMSVLLSIYGCCCRYTLYQVRKINEWFTAIFKSTNNVNELRAKIDREMQNLKQVQRKLEQSELEQSMLNVKGRKYESWARLLLHKTNSNIQHSFVLEQELEQRIFKLQQLIKNNEKETLGKVYEQFNNISNSKPGLTKLKFNHFISSLPTRYKLLFENFIITDDRIDHIAICKHVDENMFQKKADEKKQTPDFFSSDKIDIAKITQLMHSTQVKEIIKEWQEINIDAFGIPAVERKDDDHCKDHVQKIDFKQTNHTKCNVMSCEKILRLMNAMKLYESLCIFDNTDHEEKLMRFLNESYKTLLDDFIHITDTHANQVEDITKLCAVSQTGECQLKQCLYTQRHYTTFPRTKINDPKLAFYCETFDNLHFYLYHLVDIGFRSDESVIHNKEKNKNGEYQCVDEHCENIMRTISTARKSLPFDVNRFNDAQNKYNIHINTANHSINNSETTFLEIMLETIKESRFAFSNNEFNELDLFLNNEEYDTDAVRNDLTKNNSNIFNLIKNHMSVVTFIKTYVKDQELSSISFSTGLIFYYWPYYKDISEVKQNNEEFYNINDHSGYKICELYTEKKYNSFKEEILTHININEYNELVILKANQYVNTEKVRHNCANARDDELHYDIEENTPLFLWNLISVILYCDFSKLCTHFSSTFRAIEFAESLLSIKERNQEFWWMSKILRETVQFYGVRSRYGTGPFYCGISFVMSIPEYCIRLCSPTSTSKDLQVSLNFATREGMIVELNDNGHGYSWRLSLFNCSWISRYKEENERLFFGGDWRIRVSSIRLFCTKKHQWKNFDTFFHALFIFNCMVIGYSNRLDIDVSDKDIILNLINFTNTYDDYIKNTFQLFIVQKRQLVLNIHYIHQYCNVLSYLVIDSLQQTTLYKENLKRNLVNKLMFTLFKNANKICIYSTSANGIYSYSFSLKLFLEIIVSSTTWNCITIKAANNNLHKSNWIHSLWSSSSHVLQSKYRSKNCSIRLKDEVTFNAIGNRENCLIIESLK